MVWLVLAWFGLELGGTWGLARGTELLRGLAGDCWLCVRLNIVSENKVTNINSQIPFRVADSQLSSINQTDKDSKIEIHAVMQIIYVWNDSDNTVNILPCSPFTMWGAYQTDYWHRYGRKYFENPFYWMTFCPRTMMLMMLEPCAPPMAS